MSTWTWWMPEKKKIDEIVETQEDEEVSDKEYAIGRKARMNRFYKRNHLRNKHICSHSS